MCRGLQCECELVVIARLPQVDVLHFEEDIRGRWAAEAMRWLLQSSSRHLTARSHQASVSPLQYLAAPAHCTANVQDLMEATSMPDRLAV